VTEAARALDRGLVNAEHSPWTLLRWTTALVTTGRQLATVAAGRGTPEHLAAWSQRLLECAGVEVELTSNLPKAQLWVSNHLSWLDPLVLFSLRPMGTLAKAEVAAYPFLGRGARRADLRFVDRDDPLSRAAALAAFAGDLRRGRPMLLFPEGTTTRGERLAPLHQGGLRAAHALGIPVLPLRLESDAPHYPWTGDEALLPHLGGLLRAPSTRIRVVPGPHLDPDREPDPEAFLRLIIAHLSPHP